MAKTSVQPKQAFPHWSKALEEYVLKSQHKEHEARKIEAECSRNTDGVLNLELLHCFYNQARIDGVLTCSYADYEHYVRHGRFPEVPKEERWRSHRFRRWGAVDCPYRNGRSYRKNTLHEKTSKEIKEAREAWREHKGFKRDKSRANYRRKSRWTKWESQMGRGNLRSYLLSSVLRGDYEVDRIETFDYDNRSNPWNWD